MSLRELIKKLPTSFRKSHISRNMDDADEHYESLSEEKFQLLMAESMDPATISIEVVYVTSDMQVVLETQVPRGANIEDGIVLSGLLEQCDEVDLLINKVGLFGMIKPLTEQLADGDRIEIYRPVTAKE